MGRREDENSGGERAAPGRYKHPRSAEDLLERYAAGERDFERADLRGADLTRANLASASLSDAKLRRAKLTEANLASVNLIGTNLVSADLRGALLIGANLFGANLALANRSGAYVAWPKEGAEGEEAATSEPQEDVTYVIRVPKAGKAAPAPSPAAEEAPSSGSGPGAGPRRTGGVPPTPARPPNGGSGARLAREGATGFRRGMSVKGAPPQAGGSANHPTSGPTSTPRKKAP